MRVAREGDLTCPHDIIPSVGIVTMPTLRMMSNDDITCRSIEKRPVLEDLASKRSEHPWVSENIHHYTNHSVLRTIVCMYAEQIFFLPFLYSTEWL